MNFSISNNEYETTAAYIMRISDMAGHVSLGLKVTELYACTNEELLARYVKSFLFEMFDKARARLKTES